MYYKSAPFLLAEISVPPLPRNHTPTPCGINFSISAKGFTLIELLVVIAILSLLISILLPSLKKAKQLAYEVTCTSNLRQIGTAWDMYLVDSDGAFPKWTANMQYFYGGKHPSIANTQGTGILNCLNYRPLNPYVSMKLQNEGGIGIFRCPLDRAIVGIDMDYSPTYGYNTYDYYGNSYSMNSILLAVPYRLRDIEIPTSLLVLLGDCQWYFTLHDSPFDANFHNYDDRVGLVFLDGHAGFIQLLRREPVTENYSFAPYWPEKEKQEEKK